MKVDQSADSFYMHIYFIIFVCFIAFVYELTTNNNVRCYCTINQQEQQCNDTITIINDKGT